MSRKLLVLLALFFVLGFAGVAQTIKRFSSFVRTVGSTSVPVALTNSVLKVTSFTLLGFKSRTTTNATVVFIGNSSTDDSQLIPLASGASLTFGPLPHGEQIDLSGIYVDVTTGGDGVIVTYY